MVYLNKACVMGYLAADPEFRTTKQNSYAVVNFKVATNEFRIENGVRKDSLQWHRIVAWNKLADAAMLYLKKGSLVYVEGKMQGRPYEKDGLKFNMMEIIASNIQFLDKKAKDDQISSTEDLHAFPQDDIPF